MSKKRRNCGAEDVIKVTSKRVKLNNIIEEEYDEMLDWDEEEYAEDNQ